MALKMINKILNKHEILLINWEKKMKSRYRIVIPWKLEIFKVLGNWSMIDWIKSHNNFRSIQYKYGESKEQVSTDKRLCQEKTINDAPTPLYSNILISSIQVQVKMEWSVSRNSFGDPALEENERRNDKSWPA